MSYCFFLRLCYNGLNNTQLLPGIAALQGRALLARCPLAMQETMGGTQCSDKAARATNGRPYMCSRFEKENGAFV